MSAVAVPCCCTESHERPFTRSQSGSELAGALGGTRTPNLLIRQLCHVHLLSAHFAADLLKYYSLVRRRRQR